jgi:hypothetical protein
MAISERSRFVVLCAAGIVLGLTSCKKSTVDAKPVFVADAHVSRHRVGPLIPLRLSAEEWHLLDDAPCGNVESVSYEVSVSDSGTVKSAHLIPEPVSCNKADLVDATPPVVRAHLAQADALIYAMHFRPWIINQHAAAVTFQTSLPLAPPEQYGAQRPFPASIDTSGVTIGLERQGCEGLCPAYSVQLKGDGTVDYDGHAYVATTGHQVAHVSRASVAGLIEQFRRANFLSSLPTYSGAYDGGDDVIRLTLNGSIYEVRDESGLLAGLPTSILALEDAIDETAGTARWVIGKSDPNLGLDVDK